MRAHRVQTLGLVVLALLALAYILLRWGADIPWGAR